ncbi:MAG: sulfotransferase, partial [Thermomonas sp.]
MFTAEVFAERQGCGAADPGPIFVLGLPRSGSTLIEQILASHSRVEGVDELIEMDRLASEVWGQDPDCGLPLRPEALLRLAPDSLRALGERYLAGASAYRRLGRPC